MIWNWIKGEYWHHRGKDEMSKEEEMSSKKEAVEELANKDVLLSREGKKIAYHIPSHGYYDVLRERNDFLLVVPQSLNRERKEEWKPKEEFILNTLYYSNEEVQEAERDKLLSLIDTARYNVYIPPTKIGFGVERTIEGEIVGIREFILNSYTAQDTTIYSNFIIVSY